MDLEQFSVVGPGTRVLKALPVLALLLLSIGPTIRLAATENLTSSYDFSQIAKDINMENVREPVRYLSSLGSRVSGYTGFFRAADYVISNFRGLGVQPYGDKGTYFENFTITTPLDLGSSISVIGGPSFKAYSLWPNHVNPSPYVSPDEGDELVDIGSGLPDDLDGKDITGKFVLMDFDSRWFFKLAAMYGAKGIIYVGEDITRPSAFQMFYSVPLMLPRLYLDRSDGLKLREACKGYEGSNLRVRVNSNMSWETIQVPNIVGLIPGRGNMKDEFIVLCAYLDSWSIIPALAPGATDACDLGVFLEAARILSTIPVDRSIILLVTAGHWQSLWGAREWIERHWSMIGTSIKAFISLDLSYDSNQLSISNVGNTYSYTNLAGLNAQYSWLVDKFFKAYLPSLRSIYGSDFGASFVDKILLTYPPTVQSTPIFEGVGTMSYDSEPYTLAAFGGGFTFHTTNSVRLWSRTPCDTFEKVDFANLEVQAIAIICSAWAMANEPRIEIGQIPSRMSPTGDWGYCTLRIQITEYNIRTAFWDSFSYDRHPTEWEDLIVRFRPATAGPTTTTAGTSALGGTMDIVAKPDENGVVTVRGLKPYATGTMEAYVVNRTNGRIEWATDLGVYKAPGSDTLMLTAADYRQMVSVFQCGSLAIFSLFNPGDLSPIQQIAIYNFLSHGPMIRQSSLRSFYGDAMVFVMPDTPIELLVYTGGRFPFGVLLNATEKSPQGSGYRVGQGETIRLTDTPLEIARDLFLLSNARSDIAKKYNTYNPSVVFYEELGQKYLFNAESIREEGALDYGFTYPAWAFTQQAYYSLMDLIWQVIWSIVFITMILIPFAVILEKIGYSKYGLKRIVFIASCFLAFLTLIAFFHPSFHIATNASMVVIAFGIMTATVPLLAFMIGDVSTTARSLKEVMLGVHTIEVSRTSAIMAAFSMGIENMKKRKFRTLLVLTSITLIIFSLITFTSIATTPVPREDKRVGDTSYPGFLIRRFPWTPIPEELYFQIRHQYEPLACVSPRVFIFPPAPTGGGIGFITFTNKTLTTIGALWGLKPEEDKITGLSRYIVRGRWMVPTDRFVCLISSVAAQNLTRELGRDIDVDSTVSVLGVELSVIGIFDGSIWSGSRGIVDLDGEPITPLMPLVTGGEVTYTLPPHFTGEQVIIIPYELAARIMETTQDPTWRFFLSSVAVRPKDNLLAIPELAMDMALRTSTDIFYTMSTGATGEIHIIRARQWYTSTGVETLLVPMVIGALVILNMMLGAVYERLRDILVFSAIGLSPFHISGLFLAESLVYSVIGCVAGYLMGITGCWIFSNLRLYPPGFYPNYSSLLVLVVLAVASAVVLASTAYPASRTTSLALPSLQRRWRVDRPSGREWHMSMPFVVTTEQETLGVMAFMKEFLESHSTEGVGTFTARDVTYSSTKEAETTVKRLNAYLRMAPYDAGIFQYLSFIAHAIKGERFNVDLRLVRDKGFRDIWIASNRPLIDAFRKQLLIWRALPQNQKLRYSSIGQELEAKAKP